MGNRQNVEAVGGSDPNGFSARKPGDEPMMTGGHQPGKLVSEADRAPEFTAQTLPAGSAPADRTFKPNPVDDVPLTNSNPAASDTVTGSTSADVHTGLGHPGQGQTSTELRHDGGHTSKKQSAGLEGVGATAASTRCDVAGAEDKIPEPAERAAAENAGPSRDG